MKEIKLTQGKSALVDDDDYEFLMQWKWQAVKRGNTFYAERRQRVGLRAEDKGVSMKMHRMILNITDPLVFVDHKDKNGLNNTKINIRTCTRQQNNMNRRTAKNSSSKYLGVSYHKHTKRWQASMTHNGKAIYIGLFKTESDAAVAYDSKAIELNGEFANLNFK